MDVKVRKFVPPTAPRPSARDPPNNSMSGLLDETERRFKAALSSSLKAHLRQAAEHTIPGLMRRIGRVVRSFSPKECRNFFRHAGYVQT
jgi:hypothetical protein